MYIGNRRAMRLGQYEPDFPVDASAGSSSALPSSVTDFLQQGAQTALQLYRQRQQAKIDIERARAGLAPAGTAPRPSYFSRTSGIAGGGGVSLPMIGVAAAAGLGLMWWFSRRR